ncbi:MAG: glucose-1-phosphate thymidylyltransferase [Sediminibacterium sp. Gen4]|jgi:UDP-N-acetylglucosamine diphosphorylase / glucose-1-phosphate thymidylyltransferase / UDP-N-acetylgalactosamine diphosphorylase / glucosamine-1-phosphate N-acetyltransferase / galactosamine-1-phosphate N-acetyltransferase|uniref:putative sugar nucleotidyl transferase n=1 Tax=unclassified Sediminibacterium TaxID=2635961 RepID=UPI0015B89DBC|nr:MULTISPECIES: putative sugar nucleotidyl transferase [unclassified Sediminibacterium]MBW0160208.1 glucose-1-phosphate thymidylyltransferase [Sediminibacterium sp.]MBW0163770.1 glucose-1-phosphate thymidylyltransferase [Sediminibacterium sp.]NWK67057.1 glucose-1-phosphate thymidylyltransferase [Sediminibacterium sp. Gen4]
MSIILFDNSQRKRLWPLTQTKAVAALRMGMLTMAERWEQLTGMQVFIHTEKYLQNLYGYAGADEHIWIDASVIPDKALVDLVQSLDKNDCWADEYGLIVGKTHLSFEDFDAAQSLQYFENIHDHAMVDRIQFPWDLIQWNDRILRFDFDVLTRGKTSAAISSTNRCIHAEHIFIESGAIVEHALLNASTGPIYIGKNAVVMEGSAIRGPFALGDHSVLKMNSRIYGATTLGPYCMGGGEIKNSIMMGYSNKAHDGYMGDAVIGEWCNWGAGTSNSNLKNTAGIVQVWSEAEKQYLPAGYKCGVIMGDYSRTAINSSINTGSVIGVSCNVFGEGLLPNIIPDFSWGCKGVKYKTDKALVDIDNWKKLKNQSLSEIEKQILITLSAK